MKAYARLYSSYGKIELDRRGNIINAQVDSDDVFFAEEDGGKTHEIFAFDLDHVGVKERDGVYGYDILSVGAYCTDGYYEPAHYPMGINPDNPHQRNKTPVPLKYIA